MGEPYSTGGHLVPPPLVVAIPHTELSTQQDIYASLLQLQREVADVRREVSAANCNQNDLHQRLLTSEANNLALRAAVMRMTSSTAAIDALTSGVSSSQSDSGADDDPHSVTELLELRRWRRQFSIESTRHLVARNDELSQKITEVRGRLNTMLVAMHGATLHCPFCAHRVSMGLDGALH